MRSYIIQEGRHILIWQDMLIMAEHKITYEWLTLYIGMIGIAAIHNEIADNIVTP